MAKQTSIDDKENTPAPGAESTSETKATEATTQEYKPGELLEAQTPEWVAEILASNQAVLESNQAVINAVADFREGASEFAKELAGEFNPIKEDETRITKIETAPEFNHYATYVVAEGKEFRDPKDFTIIYKAGDDVDHLGPNVLIGLLDQGLVIEEDED